SSSPTRSATSATSPAARRRAGAFRASAPTSTGPSVWSTGSRTATIACSRSSTRLFKGDRDLSAARYQYPFTMGPRAAPYPGSLRDPRALGLRLPPYDGSRPQAQAAAAPPALRGGRYARAGASPGQAAGARGARGQVQDARGRGAPLAAAEGPAASYV